MRLSGIPPHSSVPIPVDGLPVPSCPPTASFPVKGVPLESVTSRTVHPSNREIPRYSWSYRSHHPRRLDLTLGAIVSLLVHGGFLYGGAFFPPTPVPRAKPLAETVIQFELPQAEPDPPETVDEIRDEPAPGEPAPPTLADLPTVVPIDAFVQPLQPPAISTNLGRGLTTIPLGLPGHGLGRSFGVTFEVSNLDEAPRARFQAQPDYPSDLRQNRVAGEVEVEYIIDSHGRVDALCVLHCSHPAFEGPVVAAVKNWTFLAGRKNGHDVNTRVRQIITFNPRTQ